MPVKITNKHSENYANVEKKVDFKLVRTIINTIKDSRDKLIFEIFVYSGINPSELVELKYTDFDFENSTIKIRKETTKNKIERTIKIPNELMEDVKSFLIPKKHLFFLQNYPLRLH